MALRDGLTGLYNRRYLEDALNRELHRAERSGKPVSVVMIDIDQFKHFNDKYGHDAGDFVLSAVARAITKSIRLSDIACRYGGEELAVVLCEADLRMRARARREAARSRSGDTNLHAPRANAAGADRVVRRRRLSGEWQQAGRSAQGRGPGAVPRQAGRSRPRLRGCGQSRMRPRATSERAREPRFVADCARLAWPVERQARSAAFTRSAVNGTSRSRMPAASNTAFASAAGTGDAGRLRPPRAAARPAHGSRSIAIARHLAEASGSDSSSSRRS